MSYIDIQTILHPTLQFLIKNYNNWTRYGVTKLSLDGTIEHTSWCYEYVTKDNTHKIIIQCDLDTDSYDVCVVGSTWEGTYQGFTNFKYERLAIVFVLKALMELNEAASELTCDDINLFEKIIDGHMLDETWTINKLFL